jgi:multidrug efflux system outer membrane protein
MRRPSFLRRPAGALVLALLPVLASCSLVPVFEKPDVPMPPSFTSLDPAAEIWPKTEWWDEYNSPELERLIQTARKNNADIAVAVARIREADAQAKISGASLLPSVDASGGASRSFSKSRATDGSLSTDVSDDVSAGLRASYELDIFGANRAGAAASRFSAEASRYDREAVGLTVDSDVANGFFAVLQNRDRLDVARRNLDVAQRVLDVVESRFRNGAVSQLDLAQQRTAVANLKAAIPALQSQESQAENNLGVLLGAPPGDTVGPTASLLEIVPPTVSPGQPSELLVRRPDIQSAEARLRGANAQIGAARAAYFPSVDLTASYGRSGVNLPELFNPASAAYALATSIAQPIFAGGAIEGGVQLAEARKEELVQTYRGTVISAFTDVQNALVTVSRSAEQEELQMDVVNHARLTFDLAESRYREGAADLLTVLDAQRSLISAEDQLVQVRFNRLLASVSLFRALGGGWRLGGDATTAASTTTPK